MPSAASRIGGKTTAETPRRSCALLTTGSHQHWLHPCDTPNMKQEGKPGHSSCPPSRAFCGEGPDRARLLSCNDGSNLRLFFHKDPEQTKRRTR